MIDALMLDSGPLGRLARREPREDISEWLDLALTMRVSVFLPEVVGYEVRRELILAGLTASINVLDSLRSKLFFRPITTSVMLQAAELWASARRRGRPTADSKGLDCDVILAAQALDARAIVVTDNSRHLSQFVESRPWQQIRIG